MATPSPSASAPSVPRTPERARFFPGQLVAPADLGADQDYFRERLRRHNRLLHGWGIVSGLDVTPGADASEVVVGPGMALAPDGEEVVVAAPTQVDVSRVDPDGNAPTRTSPVDVPWPVGVSASWSAGQVLYLAARYDEHLSRPVPLPTQSCGCDASACEYSRVADGVAFRLLTSLPATYDPMPDRYGDSSFLEGNGGIRPLPLDPTLPWVVLGALTMDGPDQVRSPIDLGTNRRYVLSYAHYYDTGTAGSTSSASTSSASSGG